MAADYEPDPRGAAIEFRKHLGWYAKGLPGSAELRQMLKGKGIEYLAAPVSGNAKVIKAGKLTFVVSGPKSAYETAKPYLDMMGAPTGQPYADNYDWFFKDLNDSTLADYKAIYKTFAPMADFSNYNGGPHADVPRSFPFFAVIETAAAGNIVPGYGNVAAFRDGVRAHGLSYAVGVQADTSVWPPGQGPLGPAPWCGWGPHPRRLRRSAYHRPLAVAAFAARLPPTAWQRVRWREGTRGPMESRFAAVRVRAAHRDVKRTVPREVEWLLVEWPRGETTPTKYWLSTVPATVALDALVRLVKIRWRIERDFQELKDELGLDHYEGRGWRGFHHHGVLCIAAYAFLAAERARLSPPAPLAFLRPARVPRGFRPRGAATAS